MKKSIFGYKKLFLEELIDNLFTTTEKPKIKDDKINFIDENENIIIGQNELGNFIYQIASA